MTEAATNGLRLRREGAIAIVTLDRPPANALTADLLLEVDRTFAALATNGDVAAAVVTGANGLLSAGMDLKLLPTLDVAGQAATVDALNRAYGRLYGFPKPLIAAIPGHAVAGGAFFTLTADWRVAAKGSARFGLTEVRVGAPFPVGPLEIARAELSAPGFRRLLLGGDLIGIDSAIAYGLVDESVAPEALESRALAVARDRAAGPAATYAAIKRDMRAAVLERIDRAVAERDDPHLAGWLDAEVAAAAQVRRQPDA